MQVSKKDVVRIVEGIWDAVLQVKVQTDATAVSTSSGRCMNASVNILGAWEGTVAIKCPEGLARVYASIMFDLEETELQQADLRDALGELANMTAGGYKSMASSLGECALALPIIAEGADLSVAYPGCDVLLEVDFFCRGYRMTVIVLERVAAVGALRDSA